MSDRKYLDSILETIYMNEIAPAFVGLAAILTYWGLRNKYEIIRSAVDKNFRKCTAGTFTPKGAIYKKCMLKAKLDGQMKALQLLNVVGPPKCKTKKDPSKCMERLKRDKASLQAKIKMVQAKLSLK